MIYHFGNFVINIANDVEAFNRDCAINIMEQINKKPDSVIGFATGSTPIGPYRELVSLYSGGKVDFSKITAFNLDEYYPIKKENTQSYHYFMIENLFKDVNMNLSKFHIPNGEAPDVNTECSEYEKSIKAAGYVDYQILGIGTNGHIGFNEPDSKFTGPTHFVNLKESTIKDNARFFNSIEDVPKNAITMGIKTIMSARKILLMASGEHKAKIIKEALTGEITPNVPASVLQLHTNVMVVLDKLAAEELLHLLR